MKGKIIVVNSLLLPQLYYLSSIIHTPEVVIKEIRSVINDYIWNGKKPKIKQSLLIQEIDFGGLKLHDIDLKTVSLRLNWIKRINYSDGSWKAYLNLISNKLNITLKHLINCRKNKVTILVL